jgi:hypothetical protein
MNIHPTRTWQEEVRLGAVPSKTTKSGLEVVYDVEYIVDFISSLLSRQESELRKKIQTIKTNLERTHEQCIDYHCPIKAIDDVLKLLHA